jgi:membrane protein required for colicin V production
MSGIAVIDIIFAALILILAIRCALRGFVGELLSMASVVLGFLTAVLFYQRGGAFVRTKVLTEVRVLPEILAFIALFLIVFIIIRVLESILQDIIERISLGGVDRFLGLIFGLLEGLVVVALILVVLTIQPLFDAEGILRGSIFAELLLPLIGDPGSFGLSSLPGIAFHPMAAGRV